jgi:hypothetical protein
MKCINATSLSRKSGQWGTQLLLQVWQDYVSEERFALLCPDTEFVSAAFRVIQR